MKHGKTVEKVSILDKPEIFQRYTERLIRLAAPSLTGLLHRKLDPEDIVQSAMASLIRYSQHDRVTISNHEELWTLLVTITTRKCRHHFRHYRTAKRCIYREVSIFEQQGLEIELTDSDPTPEEVCLLVDLVNSLLQSLDEHSRAIVELSLQDCSPQEIAGKIGLSERTVYRQLDRAMTLLRSKYEEDRI